MQVSVLEPLLPGFQHEEAKHTLSKSEANRALLTWLGLGERYLRTFDDTEAARDVREFVAEILAGIDLGLAVPLNVGTISSLIVGSANAFFDGSRPG